MTVHGGSSTPGGARVIIGLLETAGVAAGLADGFAQLGWTSTVALTHEHPFGYAQPFERYKRLTRVIRYLSSELPGPLIRVGRVASLPFRVLLFIVACSRNDVFVFISRSRFVSYRERGLLKLLGKQVVEVFLGSDIRPPYMDGNLMRPSYGVTDDGCRALLADTQNALSVMEQHADLILAMPTYAQLLSKRTLDLLAIGLPLRSEVASTPIEPLPSSASDEAETTRRVPVVLHSPSSPEVKGTDLVRAAVAELVDAGLVLDYRELSGVPNKEIMAALGDCDLVIDQCYSDTPMAMFATEAAKLGRPVIVGGYGWAELERLCFHGFMPPTITCDPGDLAEVIRRYVSDPEQRAAVGVALASYVERLEPRLVAERLLLALRGDAPAEWFFDPREVTYVDGCGLSRERAAHLRADVLGVDAR